MPVVFDIPSIFNKPTQIPSRIGNTLLTGNEFISGNLSVNGSLTLNELSIDNYQNLDLSMLNVRDNTQFNIINSTLLNNIGDSSLNDISCNHTDISGTLNVSGNSILNDISCEHLDINGRLKVLGNSILNDISCENFYLNNSFTINDNRNLKDISCDNIDISGDVNISNYEMDNSAEPFMFDTIILRRPRGYTPDGSADGAKIQVLELQLWINNLNVLPTMGLTTTDIEGNNIGNTIEFIIWTTKKIETSYNNNNYRAINCIDNNLVNFGVSAGSQSSNKPNDALYVPLTNTYSINNIQSIVYYNTGTSTRAIGTGFELYNRKNDPYFLNPIIVMPEITIAKHIYRYDFPSLPTYTNTFATTDSTTNIISNNVSEVYSILKKEIVTKDTPIQMIHSNSEERLFDTIVIRRPTGYSGNNNYQINLNELQCWVNNSNILADNSSNLYVSFVHWPNINTNVGTNGTSTNIIFDNILKDGWDVTTLAGGSVNSTLSLLIKNIPTTNINDLQSILYFNNTENDTNRYRTIGLAIELYNSANDPALTKILASTNIISKGVSIYRFDFAAIGAYTKGFSNVSSSQQIISSSNCTIEISESPNDIIGLSLNNCIMGVTEFADRTKMDTLQVNKIVSSKFRSVTIFDGTNSIVQGTTTKTVNPSFYVYGGTLIFTTIIGLYTSAAGGKTITLNLKNINNTTTYKTNSFFFYFNNTLVHQSITNKCIWENVASGAYLLEIVYPNNVISNEHDQFRIIMDELPYYN